LIVARVEPLDLLLYVIILGVVAPVALAVGKKLVRLIERLPPNE
jgi:hypothetical protein